MTHTAGPWSAWGTGRNWMIRDGAGNIAQTLPTPEFGQEAANARLIAAAPELLAAAKQVLADLSGEEVPDADTVERLEQAIAKVEQGE